MASNFGNTWWGMAWLNSLSHIDYENRIPRGASYARKGAVTVLKINENIVDAKVKGTRVRPYKVKIVLPKFTREDIDRLIDAMLQKPALITSLFQRQLTPEVADIARQCGLKIFPAKWSDLKMACDCPDWAVPCKHIAAVIYMLSREIDNNPFLVFEMHGVDLLSELAARNINVENKIKNIQPTALSKIVTKAAKSKSQNPASQAEITAARKRIDFSKLSKLSEASMRLLPDNPPFYFNGNFKAIYEQELNRVTTFVERYLGGRMLADAVFPYNGTPPTITPDTTISILVDQYLDPTAVVSDIDGAESLPINALAQMLLSINPDFLPDYDQSVQGLHTTMMAAVHIAANGLLKPEIVNLSKNQSLMLWTAMRSDANVAEILSELATMLPIGTLQMKPETAKTSWPVENQESIILSIFLSQIVVISTHKGENAVTELFFDGAIARFDGIGEKEIPGAIKTWTDRLLVTEGRWTPVLYFSDTDDEQIPQFFLNISVEDTTQGGSDTISLQEIMVFSRWDDLRYDILQSVMQLSNIIPGLVDYVNDSASTPIRLSAIEIVEFITKIIPSMRMLGLKVFMPKSLSHLLKPKASLRIKERDVLDFGVFSISDFFCYDWRVAVGDELLGIKEFEQLIAHAEGLIKFKKSYIYVSPADLEKLRARLSSPTKLTSIDLFKAALSEQDDDAPVELSEGVLRKINEIRAFEQIDIPEHLNAKLRPYQLRGYSWLYRNMMIGFGSILADDMGLGKTLQAITLMLKLKEENALADEKMLVVAPVGLLYNWQAEIRRFAPTLATHIYHGTDRTLKDAKNADVVLTSYGIARSDTAKLKKEKGILMVIDEAQNIKNPKAEQSKAVNAIDAKHRIALSGTPVENRLSEFWSIMNFTNHNYLGNLTSFTKDYAKPIQVYNDAHCADELKKITAPFLMRRMKTDKTIINDLPDKIERNVYASLSPQQAALYEQTLNEAMAVIEGMATDSQQALFKRQGIILQMILALKQICDHPALFLKNENTEVALSGKAQLLIDRVQTIVDANDKVLIFTQYREMGAILQKMLADHLGTTPLFYHGGCSPEQRRQMVERFQNSRRAQVFILSLKAAGTGLNLTAANNVIHYDLWWNPAVESQATDRAYRIGQKRNVIVDRFITTGTFEERINDMINSKRNLAEMTVATGESWIGNLSNRELHELFDR